MVGAFAPPAGVKVDVVLPSVNPKDAFDAPDPVAKPAAPLAAGGAVNENVSFGVGACVPAGWLDAAVDEVG